MTRISFLIITFLSLNFYGYSQNPVSHPDALWGLNDFYTDEFNADEINSDRWNNAPSSWATWSWEEENAYITDSVLTLRMIQKTHTRNNTELYFTSGIVRNEEPTTYGYFETRMKGSDKGQGTCPAFWMYSRGEPTPTEEGGVKYCEIDAIEIFQKAYEEERLEMNLHARIIQDGELTWIRPGQGHTELTHNTWLAPWHPSDDYHTYGVWNRLDSIFWYVDGIQRGAKKNHYWHLPMYLTVSMGLRTPYEMYINGVRTAMPFPDTEPEEGFPTEMHCDYVRVWNTDAQLHADREKYYDAEYPVNGTIDFDCRFYAGHGETLVADVWNGMSCKLQEIQADGTVVQEFEEVNATVVGEESGLANFTFLLNDLDLVMSSALPEGHQYILKPVFRTSLNGGEDIYLKEEFYPIQLGIASSVNTPEAKDNIKIISSAEGVSVNMENINDNATIMVYDLTGRLLQTSKTSSQITLIHRNVFPSSGIYVVSVVMDGLHRVKKVAVSR